MSASPTLTVDRHIPITYVISGLIGIAFFVGTLMLSYNGQSLKVDSLETKVGRLEVEQMTTEAKVPALDTRVTVIESELKDIAGSLHEIKDAVQRLSDDWRLHRRPGTDATNQ